MSFLSAKFLLYVAAVTFLYYVVPKKKQWIVLLLASYFFYAAAGVKLLAFLMCTTLSTYGCGLLVSAIDLKYPDRKEKMARQRPVILATLFLNFGILFVLKYMNFVIDLVRPGAGHVEWALPLGISFYTFQSVGYILDVYWKRTEAEKNPFRFALFVSFFPQLLQGPIGRYSRLAKQYKEEHSFSLLKLEHGVQRMLWGYFQKFVLADRAGVVVTEVFNHDLNYSGITHITAVLFYAIQLYADFSGGMDVVIGIAEILGITLDENFRQPYFSVSITDFWHRWHITLGTWMKDYLFYPMSLSKWMSKYGKHAKKVFGKRTGRIMPIALSNIIVFLVVGIWHGSGWKYIVYGLYNGGLIALANLCTPLFEAMFRITKIDPKSRFMHVVRIIRTFILVLISFYFDIAGNLRIALRMLKASVTGFTFRTLTDGTLLTLGLEKKDYLILLFGVAAVFTMSLFREFGHDIRLDVDRKALPVRWVFYLILFFSVPLLGMNNIVGGGGFIYARF